MAGALGLEPPLRGGRRRPAPGAVRAVHVPLSERGRPPGARAQLHLRRPAGPAPHHARARGAVSVRVRLLRPARRERRDPHGRTPPHLHRGPHRGAEGERQAPGRGVRLASRGPQPRSRLHPVEPGHLPAVPRSWPGLPGHRPRQLVPRVPDGARQRAGAPGRDLRTLRGPGHPARPGAVVPAHHGVRRRAPRRPRRAAVARAGQDHAAQLDRSLRRRRIRPGGRGRNRGRVGPARVHHPPRHELRHDLCGGGPRAPHRRHHHH